MGVGYTARDTRTLASPVQEIPTGGFARVGANKNGNVLLTECLIQNYLYCFFYLNVFFLKKKCTVFEHVCVTLFTDEDQFTGRLQDMRFFDITLTNR